MNMTRTFYDDGDNDSDEYEEKKEEGLDNDDVMVIVRMVVMIMMRMVVMMMRRMVVELPPADQIPGRRQVAT